MGITTTWKVGNQITLIQPAFVSILSNIGCQKYGCGALEIETSPMQDNTLM